MSGIRRAKFRRRAFGGVFYDPSSLRREVLWENVVPAFQSSGYFDAMRNLVGYDIRGRLEEIGVPTLIVWGRNDRVVPPADAGEFARRLRNSTTVIFDGCGHLVQAERPVRFNRLLDGFLA
jgi:2-hydroxy-6-oxonona-2,4-dienedioate hydrolase